MGECKSVLLWQNKNKKKRYKKKETYLISWTASTFANIIAVKIRSPYLFASPVGILPNIFINKGSNVHKDLERDYQRGIDANEKNADIRSSL